MNAGAQVKLWDPLSALEVCSRRGAIQSHVFTALHVMQTRYSDENYVRLSVCPSVCHTRVLWQNGRKICPDFIPYEIYFSLVYLEENGWWVATPSTGNFGSTGPRRSKIADFGPIIARSASAVTSSGKSSINANRKSTTCFPMKVVRRSLA